MKAKKIHVIGAGLGGLAISCLLASDGHRVTVFEKNKKAGGKINEVKENGFRFDTGPSLLTMPFILEELFSRCGNDIRDYIQLKPVEPICRYFYSDGITFSCFQELNKTLDGIRDFAPSDAESYKEFLEYASNLYDRTKDAFLFNPLYSFQDLGSLNLLDFLKIDAFTTVSERVDKKFRSPHLRQFFKRFTTYNGSSPYRAPATLNVIPHVELSLGGYYVQGGMYRIVEALQKLAEELGVEFVFNRYIQRIKTDNRKAKILIDQQGTQYSADLIVSNSDAAETYLKLLDEQDISAKKQNKIRKIEPSCSGFVLLLGIDKTFEQLTHHNIFFSDNYEMEFRQIFEDKIMPDDPTIYIADTSLSNPEHAPGKGSNLFILVNAPYLSENFDWEKQEPSYTSKVISKLEQKGLTGLSDHIVYRKTITPKDFRHHYLSNHGSIYGTSSNDRLAAFLRPRNKSRELEGLYLTGGSTHPGGGIPLVILSAFHAAELIERYEE